MQAKDIARFGSRHPLWSAAAAAVLLLGLGEWLEWPFLRAPLERALSAKLERQVTIGDDFGVRLFGPLRLRGDLLVIPAPADGPVFDNADGSPRDLIRAEHFALTLPWPSVYRLLRGGEDALHIRTLDVDRLDAGLKRDAAGRVNWQFGKTTDTEARLPEFDRLTVRGGRIGFADERLRLDLDATVRTLEGSDVGTTAGTGLEAVAEGSYRGEPVTARLRASGLLPLAAAQPDTPAVPLRFEVRIAGNELHLDGRGRDVLHLHAFDGSYRVKGDSLSTLGDTLKVTLPTTGPFASAGRLGKDGRVWNVVVDAFSVGDTRLNGRFRYDRARPQPLLSGELNGPRLALPDLIPALGGRPREAPPPPSRDRLLPRREFDIPSLGFMDADVALRIDSFALGTVYLEPIEPLVGRLILRNKVLAIEGLRARTAGGELRGSLSLDARQALPHWKFDLAWSGVDLERFVRARDPVAPKRKTADREQLPGYVSGVLGGRAKLAGSGRSTAAMLASLDGDSQWWVSDGRISRLLVELIGLDVAQSLGMLVAGDRHLPVRCAVANLAVRDGVMRPAVAVVDTDLSTTSAGGEISLADERLALRFMAHPRNVSPLALRSPVRVEGSFAEPRVRLDPVSIGSRVAAAAALAAISPAAALLALIDIGDPEKAVCRKALERMQPAAAPQHKKP